MTEEKDTGEIEVCPTTMRIAVFLNQQGDVVIKQDGDMLEEDDSFVVVPRMHVEALIKALREKSKQWQP